ncbi:MAG: hypothetical protein BalsKO_06150 [Balneolaceae bacterium]
MATAEDHLRITIALGLSFSCAFLGFILNWLTLDGFASATLFGLISFGLGSYLGAAIVLAFFISSSLLSKDLISEDSFLETKFRRDGVQVWSNGFWFALWVIIWFLSKEQAFLIAGVGSMAAATADTWASEIGGHRIKGKTWLFPSFEIVKAGTDGGVSILGTLASLFGSIFIATIFWLLYQEANPFLFFIIVFSGVIGSLIDSLLGSKVQGKELTNSMEKFFSEGYSKVGNNTVNWLATGSASFVALIALLFIGQ